MSGAERSPAGQVGPAGVDTGTEIPSPTTRSVPALSRLHIVLAAAAAAPVALFGVGPRVAAAPPALPAPALTGGPSAAAEMAARLAPSRVVPASSPSITITGHGLGHGRGLGQWGAYGYASESSYKWTYKEIVDHFYGGTYLEPVSAALDRAPVNVNLSELDGATTTTVRAHRSGAELTVNGGAPESGTIVVSHPGATETIRATAGDVSVDLPGVGWRTYQGYIQVQPSTAPYGEGGQTWNVVPLEEYVAGVVPGESPAYWGVDGEAALQAQAVASRAYGLAYEADADGRTCDTTQCQEYLGDPSTQDLGSYATYSNEATSTTKGEVMCIVATSPCPGGDIATTEFSASTGGWTAGETDGVGFPAVVDDGDAVSGNTNHDWTVSLPLSTIEAAYPSAGPLTSLLVTQRNGYGSYGGRAVTVQIKGTAGTVTTTGDDVAATLGLQSDWFRFATQPPA